MLSELCIELPFPSSELAGHGNKHFWMVRPIINAHRAAAKEAVEKAGVIALPESGDIPVSATFHAPNNRGDRLNYPNRLKAYWDGIADALNVNDKRFLPSFHYGENETPGRVVIVVGAA